MNHYHDNRRNSNRSSYPRQYVPQRTPSNQQPAPNQQQDFASQFQNIPTFNPDDYPGFKDLILAASIPDEEPTIQKSRLQEMTERSVENNGRVMETLWQVANYLHCPCEFLARPPFLTDEHISIEKENMKLQYFDKYTQILNSPVSRLIEMAQE